MSDTDEPANRPASDLEVRAVEVRDPDLSAHTNERLTDQLQDVVGKHTAKVPKDRPHTSRGQPAEHTSASTFASTNWLMAALGGFAVVVIAGIVCTAATHSGWCAGIAVLLDIAGIATIAVTVTQLTSITERPEPALIAAMESEGVVNPEQRFSDIVQEFRETDVNADGSRNTTVEDDPVAAGDRTEFSDDAHGRAVARRRTEELDSSDLAVRRRGESHGSQTITRSSRVDCSHEVQRPARASLVRPVRPRDLR